MKVSELDVSALKLLQLKSLFELDILELKLLKLNYYDLSISNTERPLQIAVEIYTI